MIIYCCFEKELNSKSNFLLKWRPTIRIKAINKLGRSIWNSDSIFLFGLAHIAGVKDSKTLGQQLTIIFEGGALIERLSGDSGAAKRAKNAAITLIKASI